METLNDSPVLVLEHNITAAFETFHINAADLVKQGVLDHEIQLAVDAAPPRTPQIKRSARGEKAQIHVHVAFLELLWAFIYSWMVVYEETVQKTQLRGDKIGSTHIDNEQLVARSDALWNWARGIREGYTRWPKNLPSPRYQTSEVEIYYAEKANFVFERAASFLLSHEFAHVTLGHLDISRLDATADILSVQLENEADQDAFNSIVDQGLEDKEKSAQAWAILSAMLSTLFTCRDLRCALKSGSHPPLHHRLGHLVHSLNFQGENYRYYFPLLCQMILQNAFPELHQPETYFEDAEEIFQIALDKLDEWAELDRLAELARLAAEGEK